MVLAFSTSLCLCSICQHTSTKCHFDCSCPRVRLIKNSLKITLYQLVGRFHLSSQVFLCQVDSTAVVNSLSDVFLTIQNLHCMVNVCISREHPFVIMLIFWLRPVRVCSFNCEIARAVILKQEIHESHFWRYQGNILST